MASPSTLNPDRSTLQRGFTIIEILIAIAILVVILGLGLFVAFDFYKSYAFRAEENIITSVLQKARNQSLSNISQVRHGVRFADSPMRYILFECPTGIPQCTSYTASSTDNIINASYGISITHPSLPFDVIFDQLSGDCITSTTFNCSSDNPVTVSDGSKSYDITINSEGRIDW